MPGGLSVRALVDRLLVPALAVALLVALALAGLKWRAAVVARAETAKVARDFADYRAAAERNYAAALAKRDEDRRRTDLKRQEALDAEHLARKAAEADAARLRAGNGQLQRLAADLSTSLGDRARDSAAPGSCPAAAERIRRLADVVGTLDDFAARAVSAADDAVRAGQLCERSYDALMP